MTWHGLTLTTNTRERGSEARMRRMERRVIKWAQSPGPSVHSTSWEGRASRHSWQRSDESNEQSDAGIYLQRSRNPELVMLQKTLPHGYWTVLRCQMSHTIHDLRTSNYSSSNTVLSYYDLDLGREEQCKSSNKSQTPLWRRVSCWYLLYKLIIKDIFFGDLSTTRRVQKLKSSYGKMLFC